MINEFFIRLDKVTEPYLEAMGIAKYKFYGTLFSWAYEKSKDNAPEEILKDGSLLSHWLNGEQALPDLFYKSALNTPDQLAEHYKIQADDLLENQESCNDGAYILLGDALDQFINAAFTDRFIKQTSDKSVSYLYAYALVHALIIDGLHKMDNRLAPEIRKPIKAEHDKCKKEDIAFTNARILHLFLQKSPSLLLNSLNRIGTGDYWLKKTTEYVNRKNQRHYQNIFQENEWMYEAKLIAYKEKHLYANEMDLLRAIMYTNDSPTLNQLKHDMEQHKITPQKWEELLRNEYDKLSKSSL